MKLEPVIKNGLADYRLSLLWIEDQFERMLPGDWEDWEPWFVVTVVDSPSEVETLLKQSERPQGSPDGPILGAQFPFDVYLTDFRLCGKKDTCKLEAHEREGIHAPAAGFMTGLLAALRAPQHVQGIIPYSAHDDEFGSLWNLTARMCPTTLTVMWDAATTKGNRSQHELRHLSSATFRRAIENSCKRGTSHIPFVTRSRIEALIASSDGKLPASTTVSFSSGGAIRKVFLGSLFNDRVTSGRTGSTVPAADVKNWLDTIPIPDPLELKARELAGLYFRLRRTPYSRLRFSLVHQARVAGQESIEGYEGRSAFLIAWLGELVRDTCVEAERDSVLRLATLFLIVSEEAHKYSVRQNAGLSKEATEALKFMRAGLGDPENVEDSFVRIVSGNSNVRDKLINAFAEIQRVLDDADDDRVAGEDHEIVKAYGPFSEVDFCHLVDPIPENLGGVGWGKEKKIGKAFSRAGLDVIRLVNVGDARELTETERLAVARYALDLGLPRLHWPNWLL